jgi:chaperonin GroES
MLAKEVTAMKLRPLSDRIVVKPIEREAKTASGIILPESAREKPQEGEVVAVGPGARNDKGERMPLDIKVGDIVLYAKYAGTEVKLNDEKLLILRESDILAVVEEE